MKEKFGFDPSQFGSIEEMPEEKRAGFKPAKDGGFVKKTAIENPEHAQAQAERTVLAETSGSIYGLGGGIVAIKAMVDGKPKELWIDRDFREALNLSALTPAVLEAIRETMPKHLKIVPTSAGVKLPKMDARTWGGHFRVDQDDIDRWAEQAAGLLQEKKEQEKEKKQPKPKKSKEERALFEQERDAYVELLTSALALSRGDLESLGWKKEDEYVEYDSVGSVFNFSQTARSVEAYRTKRLEKDDWSIEQSEGVDWRPDIYSFVAPKNKDVPWHQGTDNPFDIRFIVKKPREGEAEEVTVLFSKTGKSARQFEKLCRLKIDKTGKTKLFRDYSVPLAPDIERVRNVLPQSERPENPR